MSARRRSAHLEEVAFVDVKVRKATYAKCENSVVRLTVTLEVLGSAIRQFVSVSLEGSSQDADRDLGRKIHLGTAPTKRHPSRHKVKAPGAVV